MKNIILLNDNSHVIIVENAQNYQEIYIFHYYSDITTVKMLLQCVLISLVLVNTHGR